MNAFTVVDEPLAHLRKLLADARIKIECSKQMTNVPTSLWREDHKVTVWPDGTLVFGPRNSIVEFGKLPPSEYACKIAVDFLAGTCKAPVMAFWLEGFRQMILAENQAIEAAELMFMHGEESFQAQLKQKPDRRIEVCCQNPKGVVLRHIDDGELGVVHTAGLNETSAAAAIAFITGD